MKNDVFDENDVFDVFDVFCKNGRFEKNRFFYRMITGDFWTGFTKIAKVPFLTFLAFLTILGFLTKVPFSQKLKKWFRIPALGPRSKWQNPEKQRFWAILASI